MITAVLFLSRVRSGQRHKSGPQSRVEILNPMHFGSSENGLVNKQSKMDFHPRGL
jgi:hypothetical protein